MSIHYPHNFRSEMHPFIPMAAERVLDIGCNTGAFGEGLKTRGKVEVWGVEPNEDAATKAAIVLDHVITDTFSATTAVPDDYFDVIVFNDVLEHLVDPWEALRTARPKLRTGGCVVASIPNLLHQENLLHLLRDRDFRYEDRGIRDRTHLRFFTRKSLHRLFEDSGFSVQNIVGINENWWSPSLVRRLTYILFDRQLKDTKYIQFAVVALPL
ncbi:class I SAM-dependent methyltransferase [Polaromonas sp. C04]|uniref:class I SAM-dependent methyltransferase n=1 Tax=Polaromonas sp. C04 TaxID=1945857 RepID=UPI0009877054|nr:class I SAM-dependent methyltransferase [Polaromonas sp. C04]OOG51171.1 hypothetical protein B0E49_16230 [Polaromonas sp. C04]